jgi:tryptophan halogenase
VSEASPSDHPKTRVVVLGGGTAGWMSAAALASQLPHAASVTLVESEEIGIVGVGEATLPHIRNFVEMLGLDEAEFIAATHATCKLGIDFRDFGSIGTNYLHPFGSFGIPLNEVPFHHWWLRSGLDVQALLDCSIANVMADQRRFARPSTDTNSLLSTYNYAYQFDATLFAPYLRNWATSHGVTRIEARVTSVERDPASGDVTALLLDRGDRVAGELFLDCSGFRSMLLSQTMAAGWEDWSHWLPCDRAVAMPSASPPGPIDPFTTATAMTAGWRWRIPLQHRVGNGYVYSSAHLSDEAAADALVGAVAGQRLADPRQLRFRAGRRTHSWVGNVVGIGLASGFLEPLESTSIYLAQGAILQLLELFPIGRASDADRAEFNRMVDLEYDRIRDFLILHYHATTRDDSPFWDHLRTMTVPDSLAAKIALWREAGRIEKYSHGLFFEPSWIAVYLGQGLVPRHYDSRADAIAPDAISAAIERLRGQVAAAAKQMPGHDAFLASLAQ